MQPTIQRVTAGQPAAITVVAAGTAPLRYQQQKNGADIAPATSFAPLALVQHTSKDAGATTSATLAFNSNNTAGNWIAVSIRGGLSSSQVFTVRDSNGRSEEHTSELQSPQ